MRSWFVIDGALPPIDYAGDAASRFPEALVEHMLDEFTKPGDLVIDPFCGFGTTLQVCSRMGRTAIGFERDAARYGYARQFVLPPHRIVNDAIEHISHHAIPPCDFALCSPPFRSFRGGAAVDTSDYYADLRDAFLALRPYLKRNARLAVEVVNLLDGDEPNGPVVPRAFHTILELARLFTFHREYVCCDRSELKTVPGYNHTYLAVFVNDHSLWS